MKEGMERGEGQRKQKRPRRKEKGHSEPQGAGLPSAVLCPRTPCSWEAITELPTLPKREGTRPQPSLMSSAGLQRVFAALLVTDHRKKNITYKSFPKLKQGIGPWGRLPG